MPRGPVTRTELLTICRLLGTTKGKLSAHGILSCARAPSEVRDALVLARERFRFLAKIHHPDQGGDPQRFIELTRLREVLDLVTDADLSRLAAPAPRVVMDMLDGPGEQNWDSPTSGIRVWINGKEVSLAGVEFRVSRYPAA
jgi:hypothetical protein